MAAASVEVALPSGCSARIEGVAAELPLSDLLARAAAALDVDRPAQLCLGSRLFSEADLTETCGTCGIREDASLTLIVQDFVAEPKEYLQESKEGEEMARWLQAIQQEDQAVIHAGLRHFAASTLRKSESDHGPRHTVTSYLVTSGVCEAARAGNARLLAQLLQLRADPSCQEQRGRETFRRSHYWTRPALHLAVEAGSAEAVRHLLDFGASPEEVATHTAYRFDSGSPNRSAVQQASKKRQHACLEVLVRAGADCNKSTKRGNGEERPSAMALADEEGKAIILKALGKEGADIGPCGRHYEPYWDDDRWRWPGRVCQDERWLCPTCRRARDFTGALPSDEEVAAVHDLRPGEGRTLPEDVQARLDYDSGLRYAKRCYQCKAGGPVEYEEECMPDMRGGSHDTWRWQCRSCGCGLTVHHRDYP